LLGTRIELAKNQTKTIGEFEILDQSRRQVHGCAEIESALTPMSDLANGIGQHEIGDADDQT
jgi:hypothetical protein